MQQQDMRHTTTQAQFPPPGYNVPGAQQTPAHLAPEHYNEQLAAEARGAVNHPAEVTLSGEEESGGYTDYFGFSQEHRYMMPDGRQWISFKTLTEGDLADYQRLLNKDVVVEKNTGNARIKINQVEERHALLQVAVTGWHMVRRDPRRGNQFVEMPYNNKGPGGEFMKWVKVADPAIVADLDETIRKLNPALLAASTETVEAIDKQIEELLDQKARILERMQGNSDSATS